MKDKNEPRIGETFLKFYQELNEEYSEEYIYEEMIKFIIKNLEQKKDNYGKKDNIRLLNCYYELIDFDLYN